LTDFFKLLNVPVEIYPHTKDFGMGVYIPQRNSEGYGLNLEAIEQFANSGVKLLITVDLGITAIEEVALANKNGIDVIITDHHLPRPAQAGLASFEKIQNVKNSPAFALGDTETGDPRLLNFLSSEFSLPKAYAILNPKTDEYPEKMLCGAGVVFKLVQGFVSYAARNFLPAELASLKQSSASKSRAASLRPGFEKWMLDMAGLATLSDMVPLLGENRVMAYFGMKVLKKSPRPGLQKLLAKMNIDQKHLAEDDIGFMLTPRLNAASRMDDPMRAYELLATNDEVEAGVLANHLSKINDERKTIVTSIMREVNKKLETYEHKEVLVIGNPKWRVGVLGLVAGKISDEHEKPVFVWGKDENDCIKGSCRSDGSVSIVELMTETRESFVDFGGHELAGGFTVHADKIHFLEEVLSESFKRIKNTTPSSSPLSGGEESRFDLELNLSDVNMKTWREIEKMSPFGFGNPKPIFLFKNVKIEKIKKFGKNGSGEHLEIVFIDESKKTKIKAISFFSGHDSFDIKLEEGKKVNLLATFDLSRFRGREELRLRIENIY
jgi:single-stranded-DNA-specific exonuclease